MQRRRKVSNTEREREKRQMVRERKIVREKDRERE